MPVWELEEWVNEGVYTYFPPVVKIFMKVDYCMMYGLDSILSKYYTNLPSSELYIYSSAKIPMDIHPQLPLLRFQFSPTAALPVVKASDYGILGLHDDVLNVLEFNYNGKVMHGDYQ